MEGSFEQHGLQTEYLVGQISDALLPETGACLPSGVSSGPSLNAYSLRSPRAR